MQEKSRTVRKSITRRFQFSVPYTSANEGRMICPVELDGRRRNIYVYDYYFHRRTNEARFSPFKVQTLGGRVPTPTVVAGIKDNTVV